MLSYYLTTNDVLPFQNNSQVAQAQVTFWRDHVINACNLTQLVTVNICYFIVDECACAAKADFVGIRRKVTPTLSFRVRIFLHFYPD